MVDTSPFLARWTAFVRRHADADVRLRETLIRDVLADGLGRVGPGNTETTEAAEVTPGERLECERALIAASGEFDEFGYFWHNPDPGWYLCGHDEELRHFVRKGWRELRHPHPDFDLWWYWLTYLDPAREDLNPLVHYLVEGRFLGLSTLPEVQPPRSVVPAPTNPRRVCLFAGFDVDGSIDDTVVAYLRDLSRFADIYYLADCPLESGELDKLAPYTKGLWAVRHGRYDFGSYSMLARELVGWDVIETYDELILANDSCYLVQPFDRVFAKMDAADGDWWGLQATYDHFTPHEFERLGRPLRLDEVQEAMRGLPCWRYSDFIHVGSYFLAVRSRVIQDPEFRRRLDTVASQSDKTTIIMKYEIGLSRYLILGGYHLQTFVDGILPYHPVYRASAFALMADGFPLLKRQFLYENPFSVPDLVQWKNRVLELLPDADVEAMDRNLRRVAPAWSLHRSFGIRTLPNGTVAMPQAVGPDTFDDEDRWVPKFEHWWAFVADRVTGRLSGGQRAVFEAVREDASIKKLVLHHDRPLRMSGANTVIAFVDSAPGQFYLLRAGTIFVTNSPRDDVDHPLSGERHRFVNLRRGTPLAAFGAAVPFPDTTEGKQARAMAGHNNDLTAFITTSSAADRAAMLRPFAPMKERQLWATGSPRTDLLLAHEVDLPADLRQQVADLRDELAGRRLVLLAPAARHDAAPPTWHEEDRAWLRAWLESADAVLGIRPPTGQESYAEHLADVGPLDLSVRRYPDVEMVLRLTEVLVSDYTPELADFPVLGRRSVCYAPDLEQFARTPGLLHDLEEVVVGPVCRDQPSLRLALAAAFEPLDDATAEQLSVRRSVLHEHLDGNSAARVVDQVRRTYLPIGRWLDEDAG